MERDNRRYYEEEPERREQDHRRRQQQPPVRRKKKKKASLSGSVAYILLICGIAAILAALTWSLANDMLALNKDVKTAVVTVQKDGDFGSVVGQLKQQGIINYKGLFRVFTMLSGGTSKISAGTYELNTSMDYRAILNNLGSNSASRMEATVTIPEGYTVRQIFELLEQKGVSTVEKLDEVAANHNYNFSFLADLPLGDATRLQGYLFPDTYIFYMGEDPKYVINKMLVNFDAKFDDALRQQVWDKGYSIGQILNIASMIEKEATAEDRGNISSVIYNRLNNPNAGTMGYLQVDATIQYVLPEGQLVTKEDYQGVNSPYNTYLHKGLPPGPIANPGMESIAAALNPEQTNYYYYILGDDDVHHFFSSRDEFEAFKRTV